MGEIEIRCQRVVDRARELFAKQPDWTEFYADVLGVGGFARSQFQLLADWQLFERSDCFSRVQQMLHELRDTQPNLAGAGTRVITVRVPRTVHVALHAEAHDRRTSLNKLCVSKLLGRLDRPYPGVSEPQQ
jgi:predicted HicB family RNase H-like nuclease